jgi:hypothetical protein
MQKYLLTMVFGIIILSGCSLNVGTSKNQEPDSKIVTENPKQEMGESVDELQKSSNPKKPYNSETAKENGDVVNIHGKISNLDKFENFIKNVESGIKDKIRITIYTVEGDPIFYNLNYDGNQIQYTFDNSQDGDRGSDIGINSASCSDIGTKNTENGVEYHLSGCSSEVGNTFNFLVSK